MSIRLFAFVAGLCLLALSLPGDARPRGLVTPGDRLFIAGLDSYEAGNHDAAYRYFMDAAVWGIKDAQFNLGVMYYHGQGTEQSYVDAYAWFAIAAERSDDLRKSQIRDECYSVLNEEDQVRAFEATLELFEEYGDINTIKRVTHWYRKHRRNTGSRVGFEGGALTVIAVGRSGAATPYNVVNWNAQKFAGSLALPKGYVEYGELGLVPDEEYGDDEESVEEGDDPEQQRD
jgi:hypothetical protein